MRWFYLEFVLIVVVLCMCVLFMLCCFAPDARSSQGRLQQTAGPAQSRRECYTEGLFVFIVRAVLSAFIVFVVWLSFMICLSCFCFCNLYCSVYNMNMNMNIINNNITLSLYLYTYIYTHVCILCICLFAIHVYGLQVRVHVAQGDAEDVHGGHLI